MVVHGVDIGHSTDDGEADDPDDAANAREGATSEVIRVRAADGTVVNTDSIAVAIKK